MARPDRARAGRRADRRGDGPGADLDRRVWGSEAGRRRLRWPEPAPALERSNGRLARSDALFSVASGDVPQSRRAFAARSSRYKLAQPKGVEPVPLPGLPHFELFDMVSDPMEMADISARHPEIVARMLEGYDRWFRDVRDTRNFQPPRIHLGSPQEDPATLTRQDMRGEAVEWEPGVLGGWDVEVIRPGLYELTVIYAIGAAGSVQVECGGFIARKEIPGRVANVPV